MSSGKRETRRKKKPSLSNVVAHISKALAHIWICKLCSFLTEERRKGKKDISSWKSCLSWLSTKEKGQQEVPPAKKKKRLYNHSAKSQHPLLERNYKSVNLLKRLNLLWIGDSSFCVCTGAVQKLLDQFYSESIFSCVVSSCRQLLRMMGSGWASVLKTQSSRESRSSSEKSRYKYLGRRGKKRFLWQIYSSYYYLKKKKKLILITES